MRSTLQVLEDHFAAVDSGDLDRILADYAPDAVLFTPAGVVRGRDALRDAFAEFLRQWARRLERFELLRQDAVGEVGYIVWRCGDQVPLATDTFVVRDGRIVAQTFACHVAHP